MGFAGRESGETRGGGGRNGAGSRGLGWVVLGKSSPESEGMEREERRIRREGDSEGGPVRYNQPGERDTQSLVSETRNTSWQVQTIARRLVAPRTWSNSALSLCLGPV